jgi:type IV pilus assembly protein PilV
MNMRRQQGVLLIENMVALVIFSIGVMGMIGLLAVGIKQASDARHRNEASFLASQVLGQMWLDDKSNAALRANYASPDGPKFVAWKAAVAGVLPQAAANAPTIAISADNLVTVTVHWQLPGKAAANRYTVSASIHP